MKKYAMMLMGNYDTKTDALEIQHGSLLTRFVTVRTLAEAKALASALLQEGFGCIELCGAFGQDGARAIAEATEHKLAVGYCVHDPDMDQAFNAFFGG